jgi:hypothetical protein
MTSQRDVLQTFGSPTFYSVGGSQQYDNELNEVGLHALYDYMGIANLAYVLRAGVDLAALAPSANAPTGVPTDGSYWLNLAKSTLGIFKSNGNVNSAYAWEAQTPTIIYSVDNLEVVAQGNAATAISDPNAALGVTGNLVINGVTITVGINDSFVNVLNNINKNAALNLLSISAVPFVRLGKFVSSASSYGDIYNLRLVASNITTTMVLTSSDSAVLTALGFSSTPVNVISPASSYGADGSYTVDAISVDGNDTAQRNRMWEKIVVATSTGSASWWFRVGGTDTSYPGWGWREALPRIVTGTVANPTFTINSQCSIRIGSSSAYSMTLSGTSVSTFVSDINTVLNAHNLNAVAAVVTVGRTQYLQIINFSGTDTWFNDIPVSGNSGRPWTDAGISPTQTYYGFALGIVNPTFVASTLQMASATVAAAGSGYACGDVLTLVGGTHISTATFTVSAIQAVTAAITGAGTGYTVNDRLTITGGAYATPVILNVVSVTGGQITAVSIVQAGQYTGVTPSNPITVTGGTGTGATVSITGWGVATVSVTVAGNYSVAPPTTCSTTGGSGTGATLVPAADYLTGDTFTIDAGAGPQLVHIPASPNNDLIHVVNAINTAFPSGPIIASVTTNNSLKITNQNNTSFVLEDVSGTPLNDAGIKVGYVFGRMMTYQGYAPSLTYPSGLDALANTNVWINTTAEDRGVSLVVMRRINGQWVKMNSTPNIGYVPLYMDDNSANAGFGANLQIGSIYGRYNSAGLSPAVADTQLYVWNGNVWAELTYTASVTAPAGEPATGALWYNTNFQFDIMVSDGRAWHGYRNTYPGTDRSGPILSASKPLTQNDGQSALVDNDIWINTSVTNAFTAYRFEQASSAWRRINITDHITPAGIVFGDARPNATGLASGSSAIEDMLLSDYVDSDVLDAHLYPAGMLLLNTRYSSHNVKTYVAGYFPTKPAGSQGRWVSASGNSTSGEMHFGYLAQRAVVIEAMQSAIVSNQDVRSETAFFNLLACPGYPETIDEMIALNADKKEAAFIIGDTPARLAPTGTAIQAWATNAANATDNGDAGLVSSSPYVGLYYPWGLATNLDGSEVLVPPSTMALRTYAYNDQVAYPWFAPAGFNRGLVTGVNSVGYLSNGQYIPVTLNQGQRDVMYINKINPIAFIPNRGLVIYGQKTLSPVASALDRVNVARLVNYLNYNLNNLGTPFLFEQNDRNTRDSVKATFNSFMGSLVILRALYDYAVICDDSNNTPDREDRNELWIDIAIKPEKSIEFIYIPIRLLNSGDPLSNGSIGN